MPQVQSKWVRVSLNNAAHVLALTYPLSLYLLRPIGVAGPGKVCKHSYTPSSHPHHTPHTSYASVSPHLVLAFIHTDTPPSPLILPQSLTCSLTPSSPSLPHPPSLSPTPHYTLSFRFPHPLPHPHPHTNTPSPTHPHSLTHTPTLPHPHSLSHTPTPSPIHPLPHPHPHTPSPTLPHPHTHSVPHPHTINREAPQS